ncbi:hypothetical protein [Actinoplanes sp. NPDC051494]|uniref:transmembrane-type terpene cyclase n=1 Tax=Actinoplanes sp. NPDC051494 TaxID=3363907 RepID=UPI0037AF34EE
MLEPALKILSGLCWTLVYAAAIRAGFRDRTYAIPAFALGLNFVWELLYFTGGVIYWQQYPADIHAQTLINGLWAALDLGILVTFFRFGPGQWVSLTRAGFLAMSAGGLVIGIGVHLAFLLQFGAENGARYSAFAQNLLMSVLFLSMLHRRRSASGQSNFIAVNKLLGTLAPTIASGFIGEFRPFIALTGLLCLAGDAAYLIYLNAMERPHSAVAGFVRRFVRPESAEPAPASMAGASG